MIGVDDASTAKIFHRIHEVPLQYYEKMVKVVAFSNIALFRAILIVGNFNIFNSEFWKKYYIHVGVGFLTRFHLET